MTTFLNRIKNLVSFDTDFCDSICEHLDTLSKNKDHQCYLKHFMEERIPLKQGEELSLYREQMKQFFDSCSYPYTVKGEILRTFQGLENSAKAGERSYKAFYKRYEYGYDEEYLWEIESQGSFHHVPPE